MASQTAVQPFRPAMLAIDFSRHALLGRGRNFTSGALREERDSAATRAGSDESSEYQQVTCSKFQSTLPARGATRSNPFVCPYRFVSIHAPRAGSDKGDPAWRDRR